MGSPFLTAEWRHLLMLNYDVERELLEPLVPAGTVLDTYKGKAYVSLVGFQFLNTRLKGLPIPFHQDFEEVNLRFYVRRFNGEEWRRGVVFIREIVPMSAIALTARWFYNEPYVALPMDHAVDRTEQGISLRYGWRLRESLFSMKGIGEGNPTPLVPGSLTEFITEHYWGYNRQRDGTTLEYQVEHPSWQVWTAADAQFSGDATELYGPAFAQRLRSAPSSAFIAEGSPVVVQGGHPI